MREPEKSTLAETLIRRETMSELAMTASLRQEMKLSPQMLETMDTLMLSADELIEKIRKKAENNPTLVVREKSESFNTIAEEYKGLTDKKESYSDSQYSEESDDNANYIERLSSEKETLYDHLANELRMLSLPENVYSAAETIITALDRNGFTGENPEEILSPEERPFFNDAIKAVQSLEPTGVGAKDWREALILQIKETGAKADEIKLFEKLIYNEMDNLKAGRYEQIAKDLRTDKEDVVSMYELLKTLTPFPGLKYSSDYESFIVPELSIKKENGSLKLKLLRDAVPIVEIDPSYEEMADELKGSKRKEDKEAERYLKAELQESRDLISQLEIRASTLERTGASLMERQRDFFMYGPLFLKGLTMRTVAEDVGVHEATISRIATAKYIDTDWGIYPIRSFFASSVESSNGDMSKNAVKERIRQIIEENTSGKALSDQKISDILAKEGIKAARRTVSKYRNELKIESSFERAK